MTTHVVDRDLWLFRYAGGVPPCAISHGWRVETGPVAAVARAGAPVDGDWAGDVERAAGRLWRDLLRRLPDAMAGAARAEAGMVRTGSAWHAYALACCAHAVVLLASDLDAVPAPRWRRDGTLGEIEPGLPVVLAPSAVLALTAAVLELGDVRARALPHWLLALSTDRSPYPPHDDRGLARAERWLRPMSTARTSRDPLVVSSALPAVPGPRDAVRVESLVSLDTRGLRWQARFAVEGGGGRWWVDGPAHLQARAADLLGATCGEVEPRRVALDHDPIDGERFGWAPELLTSLTGADLRLR